MKSALFSICGLEKRGKNRYNHFCVYSGGFYADYQPWITLIYLAIFLGPVIGFFLL